MAVQGVMLLGAVMLLGPGTAAQGRHRTCVSNDTQQGAELHTGAANHLPAVGNTTMRCDLPGSSCYGLWEMSKGEEIHLVQQGCWTHVGGEQECHGDRCLVTSPPSTGTYIFCCCSSDLCNHNYTLQMDAAAPPSAPQPMPREETLVTVTLVTVALVTIALVAALFLGYRRLKGSSKQTLSDPGVMEAANTELSVDMESLKLLELIGRGRYGSVYKCCLNQRVVAVKLFSAINRQNYVTEHSIYQLPLLREHGNIAHFLSADKRTTPDGRIEYLIMMEYYHHGSLSRYLSHHSADWSTCCRLAHSLTRGLAFLHTEICQADVYKPAVSHRDLNSRNVLVKSDLSCVIADFGLSMKLTGSRVVRGEEEGAAISEVGTLRYIAPEVLEGAVNLRDCESALKQVDVYALGLLLWEIYMRCSDLFPGEPVPPFQVAFQAEVGNHPSFEEMQFLVSRQKQRPRFPESWKENDQAVRALKDTMEDCWDQDAEARLSAQCAEERVCELLLNVHTAMHNHRNLSTGGGSYIEDHHVMKNLHGDGCQAATASVIMTTGGVAVAVATEKNRKSINCHRQQALCSDASVSTTTGLTPVSTLTSISEHTGGDGPSLPVCLQLTEEDLETTKLDPREVDKNLRESSDENLMEHSEKQFSSDPLVSMTTSLLFPELQAPGSRLPAPGSQVDVPLPKQQNLPRRPSSLPLQPQSRASPLGKSNLRQVETGVAKMNTVMVAAVAEPHLVTTVTRVVANGYNSGVPSLVAKGTMGGRTNLAGPQEEEEEEEGAGERGMSGGEESSVGVLQSSPDEHAPLLLPADLHHHHHPQARPRSFLSGRGTNCNNNNNNRLCQGSEVNGRTEGVKDFEPLSFPQQPLLTFPPGGARLTPPQAPPTTRNAPPQAPPATRKAPPLAPPTTRNAPPQAPPTVQNASLQAPPTMQNAPPTAQNAPPQAPPTTHNAPPQAPPTTRNAPPQAPPTMQNAPPAAQNAPPQAPPTTRNAPPQAPPTTQNPTQQAPPITQNAPLRQVGGRADRPCSLDLSSSSSSISDDSSTSGEKIKRRVKTPYTLKKWRPASWVVSTETTFDLDPEVCGSVLRINQSKSSMAVFLVGGGATSTVTSDPGGTTCL